MTNEENFEADASIPTGDLSEIINVAKRLVDLDQMIEEKQAQLKALNDEYNRIQTGDLPELMDAAGMAEFVLHDGRKIKISDIIKASIPSASAINKQRNPEKKEELQERHDRAIDWLRNNNADSLIKNSLIMEIGKGQDNIANDIAQSIKEKYEMEVVRDTSVHSQTLSAFVREKISNGDELPFDIFSVYSGRKATITNPR